MDSYTALLWTAGEPRLPANLPAVLQQLREEGPDAAGTPLVALAAAGQPHWQLLADVPDVAALQAADGAERDAAGALHALADRLPTRDVVVSVVWLFGRREPEPGGPAAGAPTLAPAPRSSANRPGRRAPPRGRLRPGRLAAAGGGRG